ncbi:MAG: hypothetical protein JWR52_1389 [Marmoricola sp.]|nr:hypothetical protein [Marmoricola sp.]
MAVKLGSDASSDAQITDGVGAGDVGAAGRLWVRFWPVALSSARQFVDPAEVPGLAAEALIGTIASIAVGRGPREDVTTFVQDAVRELGEDDEPGAADRSAAPGPAVVHPDVFASRLMSQAFAGLSQESQTILWGGADRPEADEALTALQSGYVAVHTENAPTAACRQTHRALAEAVRAPSALLAADWVHMSSCAWCTEAFHELAFSSVAITALVDPALVARATVVAPVEVPPATPPVAAAPVLAFPLFADEPSATEPWLTHDETTETAAVDPEEDAGSRRRLVAMIAGVAAAVIVAVTAIAVAASSQGNGSTTPPSAGHQHGSSSTLPGASPSTTPSDSATTTSPSPSSSASVDAPTASPTPVLVVNNATATPKKPAPRPTSTPSPTATKPTASPTSKPTTPAPSPTPTKPYCNLVMHLLGAC